MKLEDYIRSIPDFPQKGILFRDITPLLSDKNAFKYAIDKMAKIALDQKADVVVGPEARGFLFGTAVAYAAGIGFVPIRKPGKLPRETIQMSYTLEYGSNTLEMHKDAIKKGQKVLLVDDLLATGGTIEAAAKMIKNLGGEVVGAVFLVELKDLKGREKLNDYPVFALIKY